jgi:hypothetical protein
MIQQECVASEISQLMLEYGAKLNESVALVRDKCSQAELMAYRDAIAKIMGDMLLEVMNPIYAIHPNLKPPGLD